MISIRNKFVILILIIQFAQFAYLHNEAKEVENKFHDVMDKLSQLDHLEYEIHMKICDESTLDGDISISSDQAQALIECGKLDDDQVWNETEGNVKCIEKAFQGMSSERVLFNILCNKTKDSLSYDPFTECIRDYYSEHFIQSKYRKQITKIIDRKQKLYYKTQHMENMAQKTSQLLKCYNKTLGLSFKLDHKEEHHNYEFENEIFLNCYALNDEKSRNESFDIQTESQKINDFIKCYDLLNTECHSIFNTTYSQYFQQFFAQNEGTEYQKFIITKMGYIHELISRCQTQEFGKMKAIDYSSKQKEIFGKLNDCQVKALQMTMVEIETLKQRQYFYAFDF